MKFHKKALHLYQKSNYWKEWWRIKEVPTEEELNNCNSLLLKTTFRNFVLIFSMGGSFFSGRLNCFQATIKLAWFPLDAFCDEVVNNSTNYEIYEWDVYFFHCNTIAVIHFMNCKKFKVCYIVIRNIIYSSNVHFLFNF